MKIFHFFLFSAISVTVNAQAPVHSDKYNVQLESSSFDAPTASKFERMLEEDIASIQLVTLYPKQIGDSLLDSTGNMVAGRVFRFESIFKDSAANVNFIKCRKTLNHSDVEQLLEILYANTETYDQGTKHLPRHGILYMDQLGNHLGFVEICFDYSSLIAAESTYVQGLDSAHYQKLNQLFRSYLGDDMSVYDTRQ